MDYFNCSYLQFYCDQAQREDASECFREAFDSVRKKALRSCDADDTCEAVWSGWCSTVLTEDGFIATFGVLQDLYERDDWMHISVNSGGIDPLEEAIHAVQQRFPSICYQGVENFVYQNTSGGEVWYEEYSHGVDVPSVNEILGKELSSALKEESFWDALKEHLEWCDEKDYIDVLNFFLTYSAYIQNDTLERLLSFAEDIYPTIRTTLEQELQENPIT